MTGKRGRPPDSEDERLQRAQTARRTVDEELAAMRRDGLMPSQGKANGRAARRLGISARTLKRLLALAPAGDWDEPRITWDEWKQSAGRWEADRRSGLARRGRLTFFDFEFLSIFAVLRARKVSPYWEASFHGGFDEFRFSRPIAA